MKTLPPQKQQIIQAHAALIIAVVQTVYNPIHRPELERALKAAGSNGWGTLVRSIRRILTGERNPLKFRDLDEEDGAIIEGILRGIQDTSTLPDPAASGDATMAAPGLASLVQAASGANPQALQALAIMAEQMTSAGGEMAQVGGLMKRLIDGERDADRLCDRLGPHASALVQAILSELGKLEIH